jgi:hypothetical protein
VIKVYYIKLAGDLRVYKELINVNGERIEEGDAQFEAYRDEFTIRLIDKTGVSPQPHVTTIRNGDYVDFPIEDITKVKEPGALILEEIDIPDGFELIEIIDPIFWKETVDAQGRPTYSGVTTVLNRVSGTPTIGDGVIRVMKYIVHEGRMVKGPEYDKDFEIQVTNVSGRKRMDAPGVGSGAEIVIDVKSIADGIGWFIEGAVTGVIEGEYIAKLTDAEGNELIFHSDAELNDIIIDGLEPDGAYTLELILKTDTDLTLLYSREVMFDDGFSLLSVSFTRYGQSYADQHGGFSEADISDRDDLYDDYDADGYSGADADIDEEMGVDAGSHSDYESDSDFSYASGSGLTVNLEDIAFYIEGGVSGLEGIKPFNEDDSVSLFGVDDIEDELYERYAGFVTANDPKGLRFDKLTKNAYLVKEIGHPVDFRIYGMGLCETDFTISELEGKGIDGIIVEVDPEAPGQIVVVLNEYDRKDRYSLTVKYIASNTEVEELRERMGDKLVSDMYSHSYNARILFGGRTFSFSRAVLEIKGADYSLYGAEDIVIGSVIYGIDELARVLSGGFGNGDVVVNLYYTRSEWIEDPIPVPPSNPDPIIPVIIPEPPVPLAPLPKPAEVADIIDDEVPLGNLPNTGIIGIGVNGVEMICFILTGLLGLLYGKSKKSKRLR